MNVPAPCPSAPMRPPLPRGFVSSVREERLRATASLRGLGLTAWRGRSGTRYVAGVHAADEVPETAETVLIAVRRDAAGEARLLDVAEADEGWVARMRARGATEIHVHRLASDAAARRAVVADLSELRRVPRRAGPGPDR
jgi:hypothetical protein